MTLPLLSLQPGDAPFRSDPGDSYTLPARFYHDPEIWAHEAQAIFARSWNYAGHVSQLAEPGCFITLRIHNENIFVARTRQGALKAFHNVCPHRGHELLNGTGRKNVITCPYHAWAFDFDGRLKSARNTETVSGFDKAEFSLREVRVEVFCGLVLVNLDPDAPPFAAQMGELETEIRRYVPSVDDLKMAQRDTYEVQANWKVLVDNFLECYHCHPAHKDFVDLVDMESYRTTPRGLYSSQCAAKPKSLSNRAYSFTPGDVDFGYAGWYVWPNFTIWAYPGEANLSVLQMNPTAPDRCVEYQDWFVKDGVVTPQLRDAITYQIEVLQPEDIGLCESVQQGLKSRSYNQGRFVVDAGHSELSEHAVHHFQSLVAQALGADLEPETAT